MVRHATGVDVANTIEVLPTSSFDAQVRWLRRGRHRQVQYELVTMQRFPDMEPFGTYPVHIIVKHRRVALIGVVINEVEVTGLFRARQVAHTTGVEDTIMVRSR